MNLFNFNFIGKLRTVNVILRLYFNKKKKNKRLVIFDIDNTITDTWPNLTSETVNFQELYQNLEIILNFQNLISFLKKQNVEIMFLSARNLSYYDITKRWLELNDIPSRNLFLVWKVEQKIKYLSDWSRKNEVFYFDDLSFNHENGNIKYYDNVIAAVNELSLVYYGYAKIQQIKESQIVLEEVKNKIICSKN